MIFPERPTGNFWQLAGSALTQGGEQANVLQDLVARRTAAALEQKRIQDEMAQRDWEFQQKQEDDAKQERALVRLADAAKNGILDKPGATTVAPAKTKTVAGPSPDMQDLQAGRPNALLGYNTAPTQQQVTTPAQTVTTPDTYRPATQRDLNQIMLEGKMISGKDAYALTPFEEAKAKAAGTLAGYTADNHADFMGAASKYVTDKLASDPTKPPSMAEVDAAAAAADPTGKRFQDKSYVAYIKSFDKAAAAQNSTSGVTRLGIGQQNADANTLRAQAEAGKAAKGNDPFDSKRTAAEDRAQRIYNSHEAKYEQKASAFIDAMASAKDKTGASDQGLIDNWVKVQTGSSAPTEAQYKQALGTVGLTNLASSFFNHAQGAKLADDKRTEMIDNLTKVMQDVHGRHMTYKDFTQKSLKAKGLDEVAVLPSQSYEDAVGSYFQPAAAADPASAFGPVVAPPPAPVGSKQIWIRDPATGQLRPQ